MMGGQGGGMRPFGQGGNTVPFPPVTSRADARFPGNNRFGSMMDNTMPMMAPPPVSMFADERYLFILRGDTLMQFDKKTLALLKSVELPRPAMTDAPFPPDIRGGQGGANPEGQMRSQTSPPLLKRRDGPGATGPTF